MKKIDKQIKINRDGRAGLDKEVTYEQIWGVVSCGSL